MLAMLTPEDPIWALAMALAVLSGEASPQEEREEEWVGAMDRGIVDGWMARITDGHAEIVRASGAPGFSDAVAVGRALGGLRKSLSAFRVAVSSWHHAPHRDAFDRGLRLANFTIPARDAILIPTATCREWLLTSLVRSRLQHKIVPSLYPHLAVPAQPSPCLRLLSTHRAPKNIHPSSSCRSVHDVAAVKSKYCRDIPRDKASRLSTCHLQNSCSCCCSRKNLAAQLLLCHRKPRPFCCGKMRCDAFFTCSGILDHADPPALGGTLLLTSCRGQRSSYRGMPFSSHTVG